MVITSRKICVFLKFCIRSLCLHAAVKKVYGTCDSGGGSFQSFKNCLCGCKAVPKVLQKDSATRASVQFFTDWFLCVTEHQSPIIHDREKGPSGHRFAFRCDLPVPDLFKVVIKSKGTNFRRIANKLLLDIPDFGAIMEDKFTRGIPNLPRYQCLSSKVFSIFSWSTWDDASIHVNGYWSNLGNLFIEIFGRSQFWAPNNPILTLKTLIASPICGFSPGFIPY